MLRASQLGPLRHGWGGCCMPTLGTASLRASACTRREPLRWYGDVIAPIRLRTVLRFLDFRSDDCEHSRIPMHLLLPDVDQEVQCIELECQATAESDVVGRDETTPLSGGDH